MDMQRGRDLPVLQRQQHLEQTRHAGSLGSVTQVALDRTDCAVACARRTPPERAGQRLYLDRVAEHRARAVRLDHLDLRGVDSETLVDIRFQSFLRQRAGRREPIARTVLVDPASGDHTDDVIAVGERCGQPLEYDDADAVGRHEPVGTLVESEAATIGRQHAGAASDQMKPVRALHMDAAGDGHFDLVHPQRLAGQMNGDEPTRTRGVDRHRRAMQIQVIRDARRQQRRRASVQCRVGKLTGDQLRVVLAAAADVDAAFPPGDGSAHVAGHFQRLPRLFQAQPLLRVHIQGIGARDAEEQRIERIDIADIARMAAQRCADVGAPGPALPSRGRLDQIATGREVAPQLGAIVRLREAPAHADDGDRFAQVGALDRGSGLPRGRLGRRWR